MVDIDHRLRECLRRFLRQIVSDAALDQAVLILAREFFRVRRGLRMWRTVRVTFEGDRRDADGRKLSEPCFEVVVFALALCQAESPAIVVDDDRNMIGVIKRRRAAIEGGVIEIPLRRRDFPDELREILSIPFVAGAAALRREIVLIPPLKLGVSRQRGFAGCLSADQIAAHRDDRLTALLPKRCYDVAWSRTPLQP